MKRIPIFATLVVVAAAAAMIALGIWQLERKTQKEALLAQLAANFGKPVMAFPRLPVGDENLFRRATTNCLEVTGWRRQGGRSAKGMTGTRQIAECRTGAEGPLLLVDMGVSRDPRFKPDWKGGPVTGTITHAPDPRPIIVTAFDSRPKALMLISEVPAPGLEPTAKPELSSVPNNHLAYAVQWFLFALVALVIYLLALHYRQKPKDAS
jgi:surfeit locus 1 family protein